LGKIENIMMSFDKNCIVEFTDLFKISVGLENQYEISITIDDNNEDPAKMTKEVLDNSEIRNIASQNKILVELYMQIPSFSFEDSKSKCYLTLKMQDFISVERNKFVLNCLMMD